ncbi:hypothetical protein AAVH_10530 [Aphelenchoides avenae]|nr:hypothetical protein AAVH_10530 [Aphelenchus avenae]
MHKCTNFNVPQAPAIQVMLIFCTVCMFAMSFTWQITAPMFGDSHAVALIGLMLLVALVNSTSNVLFMPYMITFHPVYLTAYFVGMGLSSLIPSVVSLAQGTSRYECVPSNVTGSVNKVDVPARFEVREFFLIMAAWMCLTAITFPFLHWFRHLVDKEGHADSDVKPPVDESSPLNGPKSPVETQPSQEETESQDEPQGSGLMRYSILLACLSFVSAQMNSAIPSVQSFATLPYSQLTYHLALAIGNIASPIACFLPMWIQPRAMPVLVGLTGLTTVLCGIIIALALQSPYPILQESVWGAVISIVVSVCASGMNSYLRTVLTSVIREDSPSESRLFWCGVFTQV